MSGRQKRKADGKTEPLRDSSGLSTIVDDLPKFAAIDEIRQPHLLWIKSLDENKKQLFATELFGVSQCLALTNLTLYHGKKSDIMTRFDACNVMDFNSSAIVIELSPLVQAHDTSKCKTFYDLSLSLYISSIA